MFALVLTATLFILTTANGGSAAGSCTASLSPLVGEGGDCSASGSSELVNEVRQNASALLKEVDPIRCMLHLGRTPEYPAISCTELAEQKPDILSGNYWILNSTQSPVNVFCETTGVFPSSLNVTGGWVRVANLNMTDPDQQCPGNLQLSFTDQPIRVCGRSTDYDCDSVTFTTNGIRYQQVCGRVRGYRYRTTDGFNVFCPAPCTVDNIYVDGVSITHGVSPRKHIWTYAAGSCPCAGSAVLPPAFVGSDYYCEIGADIDSWNNNPLWDGLGCSGTCCDPPNLPWFCKELPEPTTDNLEFRICGNQDINDEDTPVDLVELYIQ